MTSTLPSSLRTSSSFDATRDLHLGHTRPAHLPTRLRPADLLRITDQGVADVLDGRYDDLLPSAWDPVHRWSARLESDDDLDLWLISWTPDEATDLHDHAGSLGALTVLSGSLREYRWTGKDLRLRVLDEGDQAAFPLGWVHDVVHNPEWARQSASAPTSPTPSSSAPSSSAPIGHVPTLSVHAYSPPLTAMSYYEVTETQSLRRTRTELTDQPE
ncbi:cysteine dioxygenase [Gordonia soli]|uniref:Putative cysteine dioxygenase n=1 Tax=Gordonia soli NBRC 108243 TaxID=1223545 RepID=M0QDP9_9ACTN|nr:cysteine dioxygenase [Gordonia soli]GAC66436.1 putative cysteine dioxygenase [Gordonia soli NBRC 108243]